MKGDFLGLWNHVLAVLPASPCPQPQAAMAARLVKQCACLLREATLVPPATAPAMAPVGRLRLAQVGRRTLTSSATSPSSHFPRSLSGLLEKEHVFSARPQQQEVDRLIEKATQPEELLELLSGGHRLHENHAALVLIQLSRLLSDKPEHKASLMQDARFQQLLQLVNSQCLELVEQFGPDELRKVLVTLAAQNRRSVPLLRAVSYHLVQKPFLLTKGVLLDLAYAYGKLGFQQTQVFQRLAADLLPHVPGLTSGEVAHCAKSFALLKWLSGPLFEAFVQHVLDRAQTVPVPHLCNVLLAFAHLNFRPERPEQEDQFFSLVHEKLDSELTGLHPALQVDVVWALCVLRQAREAELRAVLRPELHGQFLEAKSPKDQGTLRKLLHVNASAQLEHPGYAGPCLPAAALVPGLSALDRKVTPLQKELQDTLKGLLGSSDRGSFAVPTQYGWVLDAEVLLDPDGQFLPLRNFVAPHLAPPSGSQPLPPGAKRLAFLRWEFSSYGSRSRDLLGRFALARRHVQAAGFLVVDVPYYEWLDLKSEWQKGAYLKDKMRKAVAEELAK
ncbi:FAST kinase domain-containing protein 4 isoform X4 [Mustela putorius furo]|uniref:FAST kinase domain-containing protein 4 n=1 Tax=Mustela putorius furo TaxID=9669 RepID=A0A8U0VB80_MUSPF|nr:FAST kinase domain-containing protein 4 isoform X4 [Mustela putorius furo]